MSEVLALETRNIFKWFPGGFANDMVDFELRQGEIHALLGENGAGKSTLMNIIYGLYAPDGGEIYVQGKEAQISDSKEALRLGIGMVHQHFTLIPAFTVLENIVLGQEDLRGPLLDLAKSRERVIDLATQYDFDIDPTSGYHSGAQSLAKIIIRQRGQSLLDAHVGDLPVGLQQRVEILKALYRKARILVLDEPTAVLTPQEIESLFEVMRNLRESGISIIFITHKLKEVMQIADRITVMRRGKVVGTTTPAETSESQLAEMMVGRSVLFNIPKASKEPGKTALVVGNLSAADDRGLQAVTDVFLEVHAGEILGLAGVQGNGQTELIEALTGMRKPIAGHVMMFGKTIENEGPRQLAELGMAYIPADRQKEGLVLPFSVSDNLALKSYYKKPFANGATLQESVFESNASHLVMSYGIQAADIHSQVVTLSGGNQQKVILAREISRPINLLIADQPTRGLDVGSIELVHRYLIDKRDHGCAILLASTDLDEILSLSDRIAVMYRGSIIGQLPAAKASKNVIGMMMAGVPAPAEAGTVRG
jgi:simple sugar transport system ATP-binding protein